MSEFQYIEPGHFSVSGDLTFASVPEVWKQARKALLDVLEDGLKIDIGAAKNLDSSGLALMVAWSRWAHCNDKTLVFCNAPEKVQKLVQINKLEELLNVAM